MEYKQVEKIEEINGKKILNSFGIKEGCVLKFTDNTFIYFSAINDYDSCPELIFGNNLSNMDQYRAELITQEELKKRDEKSQSVLEKIEEKRELATFARLKLKYESGAVD